MSGRAIGSGESRSDTRSTAFDDTGISKPVMRSVVATARTGVAPSPTGMPVSASQIARTIKIGTAHATDARIGAAIHTSQTTAEHVNARKASTSRIAGRCRSRPSLGNGTGNLWFARSPGPFYARRGCRPV